MKTRHFAVFVCLLGCSIATSRETSVEMKLVQNLTSYYDRQARPVRQASDTVLVSVGIALQQIIDLDEPVQILTTNNFLRAYWTDPGLSWNPGEFGNITSVRLDMRLLWKPDLTLYNSVSTDRRNSELLFPAIVYYDGTVGWLSHQLFSSACNLNMRNFPWDRQICELEMGSWTYDSGSIRLAEWRGKGSDTEHFMENGEWVLEGMSSRIASADYPCCEYPFESIIFSIQMKRKPMFYVINIILPCVSISFVGLLSFLVPPNSGEKVSLSVTVLLASTVFLLILADLLPPQSATLPRVSEYFECVIFLLALSTVVTVVILNVHHREEIHSAPPKFLRYIFLNILARLVFMHRLATPVAQTPRQKRMRRVSKPVDRFKASVIENHTKPLSEPNDNSNSDIQDTKCSPIHGDLPLYFQARSDTGCAKKSRSKKAEQITEIESSEQEWILIAMILDRIFFFVFLVVTCVTSVAILLHK